MMKKSIALGFFLCLTRYVLHAQDADAVVGEWYTTDQRGKVEIYPCEEAYCGKITWLKEPDNPDGSTRRDIENPDPELRDRPVQGLQILEDLEYEGEGTYEDGEIYDPESGKTYSCLMRLSDDGSTLEIRGFIGISFIGRSEAWTRAGRGQ